MENICLPPNASPEEIEAFQKMMDTMVTFIRASTHLMNTINNKVEKQIQARASQPTNQQRIIGPSTIPEDGCIPECVEYVPKPTCHVCGKPQTKRPSRSSSIPVVNPPRKTSTPRASNLPPKTASQASAELSFHSVISGDPVEKQSAGATAPAPSTVDVDKEEPPEAKEEETPEEKAPEETPEEKAPEETPEENAPEESADTEDKEQPAGSPAEEDKPPEDAGGGEEGDEKPPDEGSRKVSVTEGTPKKGSPAGSKRTSIADAKTSQISTGSQKKCSCAKTKEMQEKAKQRKLSQQSRPKCVCKKPTERIEPQLMVEGCSSRQKRMIDQSSSQIPTSEAASAACLCEVTKQQPIPSPKCCCGEPKPVAAPKGDEGSCPCSKKKQEQEKPSVEAEGSCPCNKKKQEQEKPSVEAEDSCPCARKKQEQQKQPVKGGCRCDKKKADEKSKDEKSKEDTCPCSKKKEAEGDAEKAADEEDDDEVCYCPPSEKERQQMVVDLEEKLDNARKEIDQLQEEMRKLQRMDPNKKFGPNGGPNPAALYQEIMRGTSQQRPEADHSFPGDLSSIRATGGASQGQACPGPTACGSPSQSRSYRSGNNTYMSLGATAGSTMSPSNNVLNQAFSCSDTPGREPGLVECSVRSGGRSQTPYDADTSNVMNQAFYQPQRTPPVTPASNVMNMGFRHLPQQQQRYQRPYAGGLPFGMPNLSPCPYRNPVQRGAVPVRPVSEENTEGETSDTDGNECARVG